MQTVSLHPHPDSDPHGVDRFEVHFERDGLLLWLRFVVEGEIDRITWPAEAGQGRADDLWRHTCFEVFVTADAGYVEYNLSPSGQWASYRFDGPRVGMRRADEVATLLGLDGAFDMVALEARIELPHDAARLALSAVIETSVGEMSYWALAHPSGKPDFHHPDSFILDLP
ncbi:MAG: DOMON-like domain-containing protein [Brevundimonas sp.]|uniref:DOMON-like domain-containing protein n=1 Tax=Brevundimonas sp. TaxID=1871086 RepID=UPI00271F57D1|nr:DOMON-like domain-containing protein [Brevundimonas sp.]MDO9587980.1 DOMON-like domain-containing protein [Brevundimonas sp.]